MTARTTFRTLLVSLIAISGSSALAQQQNYPQPTGQQYAQPAGPQRPSQQYAQPAGPQRPNQQPTQPRGAYPGPMGQTAPPHASAIVPQNTPTLQRRPPQTPPPTRAPFQLTPAEQAEVDGVLKRWDEASKNHKRIVIEFNRFEYKPAFATKPNTPLHIEQGKADFTAEGKWRWDILGEWVNNKVVPGQRREQMLFDGKSIYEFNYPSKVVTQYVLRENMKGEDMVAAMLPFLFGSDMETLRKRYLIRLLKVPAEGQVCIDAWPRYQGEASNYKRAQMFLDLSTMKPVGLKLTMPNGTDSYTYDFTKVDINPRNLLGLIYDSTFKVKVPSEWTTHVEQMPDQQVSNRPPAGPTR